MKAIEKRQLLKEFKNKYLDYKINMFNECSPEKRASLQSNYTKKFLSLLKVGITKEEIKAIEKEVEKRSF